MKSFIAPFLLAALFNAHAEEPPTFECKEATGAIYRVWLTPQKNLLTVTDKGVTNETKLAAANLGRAVTQPGDALIYNGWRGIRKNPLEILDLGTEWVTHYRKVDGKTVVAVSLVIHHREHNALTCQGTTQGAPVVLLDSLSPAVARYAEAVARVVGLRTKDGALRPEAILTIESAIQRYANLPTFKEPATYQEFVKYLTPVLGRVAPSSIAVVGDRMPQIYKSLWNQILEDTKYRYFPETERYVSWVKEGAQTGTHRDLVSVRSGYVSFMRSPLFAQKDLRDFFARAVSSSLRELDDIDLGKVGEGLSAKEKAYLKEAWVQATGKKTLSDYPEIEAMAAELGEAIGRKEFDPVLIKDRFMVFYSTPLAKEEEARTFYVQAAQAQVKRLTPRQIEDVNGHLNEAGKKLFREMLH